MPSPHRLSSPKNSSMLCTSTMLDALCFCHHWSLLVSTLPPIARVCVEREERGERMLVSRGGR